MAAATITSTIGFPRIGERREMKKALEAYWSGKLPAEELVSVFHATEKAAWTVQKSAGIDLVGLDSTYYDQILDLTYNLGLVPERFAGVEAGLPRYFAMARGVPGATALDMQKYFDTNYHYLVPELTDASVPQPNWTPLLEKVQRGQAAIGAQAAVPIVVGPNTFVALASGSFDKAAFVKKLVPHYVALLEELKKLGVPEVQIHEPVLTLGTANELRASVEESVAALAAVGVPLNLVIQYDDVLPEVYDWVIELPVAAISLDFAGVPGAASGNSTASLIDAKGFPKSKRLGAGIIDGRSVWTDADVAAPLLAALRERLGADAPISVQSSTSLQHVPYTKSLEAKLPKELVDRLSFAVEKVGEIVATAKSSAAARPLASFGARPVATAGSEPAEALYSRSEKYEDRRSKQRQFPAFPTTSIGSFPQTPSIRKARAAFRKGELSELEYKQRMAGEIGYAIGVQDALGMDVLVHGEPERTDMVEYFGMKLHGYAFTVNGWVQSYGSRYVRPPIVSGDVTRAGPMTVNEYVIAASLTEKPVKGMLTGPVTMLNWSFPRKDIPRSQQAAQLALALREEVDDLVAAGCEIIQVDEPALREGLPLKSSRWEEYLHWAVRAFRLSTASAPPAVQIVTHLCYSSFEDIIEAIDGLDADVLTIENSRSDDAMLRRLAEFGYSRDVGPGVYDVHSPVVPTVSFMADKLTAFLKSGLLKGDATRLWANPDCGLKTRKWAEVIPSLRNMVEAAAQARASLSQ